MKKKVHELSYSLLILFALFLVIIWSLFGIFRKEEKPDSVQVAVIIEDSNNPRWNTFKLGLETAAREAYVDLSIVSTSDFKNEDEERSLIKQKVQDGELGVILSPFSKAETDDFYENLSDNVSLCFVNAGIDRGENRRPVMEAIPDHEEMARSLLNQIKADFGKSLKGKSIQLMVTHDHEKGTSQMLDLVEQGLRDAGCRVAGTARNTPAQKRLLRLGEKPDIMVAFDDSSLQTAAAFLAEDRDIETKLYGAGRSEINIYYLEKGIIKGMLIPDDFNMGYMSLSAVAQNIRKKYEKPVDIKVDYFSLRPDDVHDPNIEKVLFPLVQ